MCKKMWLFAAGLTDIWSARPGWLIHTAGFTGQHHTENMPIQMRNVGMAFAVLPGAYCRNGSPWRRPMAWHTLSTRDMESPMNFLEMRHDAKQTQALSPRLQHAVRLLQMSSMDFAATVHTTLGRNPFLELDDEEPEHETDGDEEQAVTEVAAEADEARDLSDQFNDQDHATPDALEGDGENDRDLWQADAGLGPNRAEDGEGSVLDMMAVEVSLAEHLHAQLGVMVLSERDLALARCIVDSLDDDGYLRTDLDELLEVEVMDPPVELHELECALLRVQALDPLGVGARSVGECLRLQLPTIACAATRELAGVIVSQQIKALAARDVNGIARHLGQPVASVATACDAIRRLQPRPGWRFGSSRVDYIVPDVIVKKVRGQWQVQLNPAIVPRVRLNQTYAELFQRHRTTQNTELAGHLQEARWTVKNAALRFSTILDVAEAIVRRQKYFLEFGAMAMKPLRLAEIAEEVGIHESTVSRVTNNKYMATPSGVFELKHFFSRAMPSTNGSACSGTAIRGLIKDLIEAEPPNAPYSDAEITRQLTQQGLVVARRTVTKYRQMLHIDAVERRRRIAC
jgi:RNA polymerase sigma-54 factor